MWPKLQNIGEKWFILSFDLRVFIEKGTILIKKKTLPYGDVSVRGARQDSESVIILNLQFLADIEIIMKANVIFIDDTHTTIG